MVFCLEQGVDCLHPKTPSSLALFKSRLVLAFWYQLTLVVLAHGALTVEVVVHKLDLCKFC